MISAELKQLYKACLVCERQKKDFDPDLPGDKCVEKVHPYSLREKMLRKYMGVPSPEADAVTDIANRQRRQKEIENLEKEREAAIRERNRPESGVSGSSRAPTDKNADDLAKLNTEMKNLEARQKADERRRADQEAAKLNEEMRQMESNLKRPTRLPAETRPSEFGPNVIVFALKSSHRYRVQASFYSKNRGHEWPGEGRAYNLNDSQMHKYRLTCQPGEQICFGAWETGNANTYWGVGPDDKYGCKGCCAVCGSTTVHSHNLIYTGSGGNSSNGISAADLLGAAVGIAGAVAGSGGSSYRAAPRYSPGPPPRNRESGVSGGR